MSVAGASHQAWLATLWGKSDAAGSMHLLYAHLLDTAAVGELIWDHFLAASQKRLVDDCCDGQGRQLFALLCGLHDVGKASPAFQGKDVRLAEAVRNAGLDFAILPKGTAQQWHHTKAGALVVKRALADLGWRRSTVNWVWPLIAAHHGRFVGARDVTTPPRLAHGGDRWPQAQQGLVLAVAAALGVDLRRLEPASPPPRAGQMTLSGAMVMADWIASDDKQFKGLPELADVSMDRARGRARAAWGCLGLSGGWRPSALWTGPGVIEGRFGRAARPAQDAAVSLADWLPAPGLLLIEAPMGEGKTEAALAAAEVLARRFGANGLFVGMPTQATSDPMFTRVRAWLHDVAPGVPLALLHGKRQFNREWQQLLASVRFRGVGDDGLDDLGMVDPYGSPRASAADAAAPTSEAPAEWFLGRKRGLLVPVTVGTIDQLLLAATRTKHVMLRYAGVTGRVVILDEVHAFDVYMLQFLCEALRWLAEAGVPVILLSATLPPSMRHQLFEAYAQGALQEQEPDMSGLGLPDGYPSVIAVCVQEGQVVGAARSADPWRSSLPVSVEVLDEPADGTGAELVADAVAALALDGGCVLVVRNTVARAQEMYRALVSRMGGDDVRLLHGRLTTGERADRTEEVIRLLGPPEHGGARPRRLVVVATQLAEQSFDVDADLLVSDVAPIDLLLQRTGRLHRHERGERPTALRQPKLIVTGLSRESGRAPTFPRGSQSVYGAHLLLRAAALVEEAAAGDGWSIPRDVPALVERGYADQEIVPEAWLPDATAAREEWIRAECLRASRADHNLLAGLHLLSSPDLGRLHTGTDVDDESASTAVRDGKESVEVVLIRRATDGDGWTALDGSPLGPNGDVVVTDAALAERVLASTVRLPSWNDTLTSAAKELRPLDGWTAHPWLRHARALTLEADGVARLGDSRVTYDDELGLVVTWGHGR